MHARTACLASAMAVALLVVPATGEAAASEDEAGDDEDGGGDEDGDDEDDGGGDEAGEDGDDEDALSFEVDVEIASAFVFRGLNQLGDRQGDQRLSVFPSITLSAGRVSGGYWGGYQLSGDNALGKVNEGSGAENDLWVSYDDSMGDLGYSLSLTYYAFPFADEASSGVSTPMYLEPAVSVSREAAVDLALNVSYFRGLQAATQGLSYIYLNPTVTRKFRLKRGRELTLGGSTGYKLWTNDPDAEDNTYDLQLDAALNIPFGSAHVTPAVHLAWTNLTGAGAGEGFVVWAGVQLGGAASGL